MVDRPGWSTTGGTTRTEIKARFAASTHAANAGRRVGGADAFVGLSVAGVVTKEMSRTMADRTDHLRARQPRSRDPAGRRPGRRAPRRDHGNGAQRLPEPGEQRSRVSVHFPRCAGRSRARDQSKGMKIAPRRRSPSWPRSRSPKRSLRAYGIDRFQLRPRIPDSEAVRSPRLLRVSPAVARAAMEPVSRARRMRLEEYTESARIAARPSARSHAGHHLTGAARPEADRFPGRRARAHHPRRRREREEGIGSAVLLGEPAASTGSARRPGAPRLIERG